VDAVSFQPRPFQPSQWAEGPHAQTLFARILRSSNGPSFERERLHTPDGDFVDLDWTPDPGPEAPIVLVMHGLEGSTSRRYMRNVCREMLACGLRPVALNFRGCSGEPNLTPRFYHSGDTVDPLFVLETLKQRHPDRRLGAMGFSLGGNVLLKMLGEARDGGRHLVDAAVAMSVPYDLAAGCSLLDQSRMGRLYTAYFMRSLLSKVEGKAEVLAPLVDLPAVRHTKTIWQFDEMLTAPLNGFDSAAHYYDQCSSNQYLASVGVPTLMLHSEDDPFLPATSVPVAEAKENEHLTLALLPRGGHVGFLQGAPWSPSFWADEESARFLAEILLGE
jgi:uncharacterized protein